MFGIARNSIVCSLLVQLMNGSVSRVFATARNHGKFAFVRDKPQPIRVHRELVRQN